MQRKFCLIDKSCERRREEIRQVKSLFLKKGWRQSYNHRKADATILFTCGACRDISDEMLREISKLKNEIEPNNFFIIGGCLPKTDKENLQKVFTGQTINPTDFSALDKLFEQKTEILSNLVYQKDNVKERLMAVKDTIIKNRNFIKKDGFFVIIRRVFSQARMFFYSDLGKCYDLFVSKGCRRNCSYCAIRFATGPLVSKPLEEVIRNFEEGLKLNYRVFNLNGDCLGDYGLDIGTDLGELLKYFLTVAKNFVLQINDLHPEAFLKYFERFASLSQQNKIHVLHLPLQSANQRILNMMNRDYDIQEVKDKLIEIKKNNNIYFKYDFIIGFPTESDKDFEDTSIFIKEFKNDHYFIGKYSDMPNTTSSEFSGKIDEAVIKKRFTIIKKLGVDIYYSL